MIFALPPPPGGCDCSGPRSSSTSKQTQCLALEDKEHGSHYSSVSFEGVLNGSGRKTAVFVARLLWFFSEVHRVVDHPEAAAQARGAKHFLLNRLEDRADGGLFWSVTSDGRPLEVDKHVYAQAIGIYALSAYGHAFADAEGAISSSLLFTLNQVTLGRTFRVLDFFAYHASIELCSYVPDWKKRRQGYFRGYILGRVRSQCQHFSCAV
jgi:N-acylglucosamine 2-epimerase (GlcNAc 2-epimerase)